MALICHSTQRAASQGVLRDEDGHILRGYKSYLERSTILYAELEGIWQGLQVNREMGYAIVVLESDSKVALILLSKGKPSWHWSLVNIIAKIISLYFNRNIKLVHVYREGIADAFAKDALVTRCSLIFLPWGLSYQV